jgi:sugar phosphate isomerase/epimerase
MCVVVEILSSNPSQVGIVPLYEQIIDPEEFGLTLGLAQALYMYCDGQDGELVQLLEENQSALEFVLSFDESWFVRIQEGPAKQTRDLRAAIAVAHAVNARQTAQRALDDCISPSPARHAELKARRCADGRFRHDERGLQ